MTKEEIYLIKHEKMKEMIIELHIIEFALHHHRLELWQMYKEYKKRMEKQNEQKRNT